MKKDLAFLKKLGARLRALRRDSGVSMELLAHRAGTSFSQVARIERGENNPTIQTLKNICDAMEIDLEQLFIDDVEKEVAPADPPAS